MRMPLVLQTSGHLTCYIFSNFSKYVSVQMNIVIKFRHTIFTNRNTWNGEVAQEL
jgi:hypothetical protein